MTMELHYSFACDKCIDRFIGPALQERFGTVDKAMRDKCYGCGRDVPVRQFSYWYPWPDDETAE